MERVRLTLHIDGVGPQRVDARRGLSIEGLIDEILNRFHELRGDNFALRRKGSDENLDPVRTLGQLGIKDEDQLEFVSVEQTGRPEVLELIERGERLPFSGADQQNVYLQEERRGEKFHFEWQPAIIGRPFEMDPSKNHLLAVDLAGMPGSEYVSRHHAAVTEDSGQFTIEALNERNPTYVNENRIPYEETHVLQPGDRIRVGRIVLIFHQEG